MDDVVVPIAPPRLSRLGDVDASGAAVGGVYALGVPSAGRFALTSLVVGNTFVCIGDSITLTSSNAGNYAQNIQPDQWPTYMAAFSLGQIKVIYNAGVSGNTSAQMLARFQTDVIAKAPLNVIIEASANDAALSDTIANTTAMVAAARAAGIRPILTTRPPTNDVTGNGPTISALIHAVNGWVKKFATAQGLLVLDFYSVLVDPASATAQYRSGTNADVTHPNSLGHRMLGTYAAAVLGPVLPPASTYLTYSTGDPSNLISNALNLASSSGVPTGWNHDAAGTGTTPSIVTGDTTIAGNWFQIARTGTDIDVYGRVFSKSGLWVTGDVMEFSCLLSGVAASEGNGFNFDVPVYMNGATNPSSLVEINVNSNITKGLMTSGPVVMPSACTSLQLQVRLQGGAGTAKIAQLTLRNLTALGIV